MGPQRALGLAAVKPEQLLGSHCRGKEGIHGHRILPPVWLEPPGRLQVLFEMWGSGHARSILGSPSTRQAPGMVATEVEVEFGDEVQPKRARSSTTARTAAILFDVTQRGIGSMTRAP